jgi:hypothetical protein
MKKSIIFSFLAAMVLFACRKSDNPKIPELTEVPVPKLTAVANSDQAIDVANNPANFKANFDVGMLFPEGTKPQKVDVVVRKNGTGAAKVVKADVTTFPTNVQVTGQQLINLFGPIALGDFFVFATDIYLTNGLKIEAFPATGVQFSGGTANIPSSAPTLKYTAICKYDPTIYQGDFKVEVDDWADFSAGDIITLTKVSDNSFSWIDPFARNPVPIIVTVNTGSNAVTIAKQLVGTSWVYSANPATYPNPTIKTTGPNNFVSPCEKSVTMSLDYGVNGVNGGTFGGGPYVLKLVKL